MNYDQWKLETPEDEDARRRVRHRLYECDLCGQMKSDCRLIWYPPVGGTIACEDCLDRQEQER